MKSWFVASPESMMALGAGLGRALAAEDAVVGFSGALGAGKTTLIRGLLRGLAVTGRVRSPTYTLVEVYPREQGLAYHLDLYRLADSAELEFLGVRDLDAPGNLVLVEWPERGGSDLPALDLQLDLRLEGSGRCVQARASSVRGERLLGHFPPDEAPGSAPVLT